MANSKKRERWWLAVTDERHLAEITFVQGRGSPNKLTLLIDDQPVGEGEFWYYSGTLGTFPWRGVTLEARVEQHGLLRRDVELYVDGQKAPRAAEGDVPPPVATAPVATTAAPPALTATTPLTLALDAGLADALRARAAASGVTVEALAEQALRVFLDKPSGALDEDAIRRLIREEMERGNTASAAE